MGKRIFPILSSTLRSGRDSRSSLAIACSDTAPAWGIANLFKLIRGPLKSRSIDRPLPKIRHHDELSAVYKLRRFILAFLFNNLHRPSFGDTHAV